MMCHVSRGLNVPLFLPLICINELEVGWEESEKRAGKGATEKPPANSTLTKKVQLVNNDEDPDQYQLSNYSQSIYIKGN